MKYFNADEKISQMIELINTEARDRVSTIIEDTKHRVQKEMNKFYSQEYDKLIQEFKEREEADEIQRRLERSHRLNEHRLDIQKYRNNLISEVKQQLERKLRQSMNDKAQYKELMQKLMVQAAIALLEHELWIVCSEKDKDLVREIMPEAEKEYRDFIQTNLKKSVDIHFSLVENKALSEDDIGGVVVYTNHFRTVYKNTLRDRLDLSFENSIPDIRRILFPSLNWHGSETATLN